MLLSKMPAILAQPRRALFEQTPWYSSEIYLHPQSPVIHFIAAKTCMAFTSGNGAWPWR